MDNQNTTNEFKIRILILLAIADKDFHKDEDKMIKSLLKKRNVDMQNYETIKNEIFNSEDNFDNLCRDSLKKINNEDDQQDLLKILFLLSMADLILHEDELRFIELCAVEWGIYGNNLKEMINN
ncbi:MAG: hypothetical protein CFH22_00952 [Alphaproteobacteria bacterium MarineAlpha5_Bin12]|nr:hypothetical protein [Candidatus Neomarinimicrobiota bacterium]PPR41268.1 MAG: hypothetical protein CFH22_00952 [Alphaproteobacteria bacterium MarineAlpha5_Bin12]|tara:strand:- start:12876 stop:13247 length:372 start_codon:yes stop_codon:yes gene_type:complete